MAETKSYGILWGFAKFSSFSSPVTIIYFHYWWSYSEIFIFQSSSAVSGVKYNSHQLVSRQGAASRGQRSHKTFGSLLRLERQNWELERLILRKEGVGDRKVSFIDGNVLLKTFGKFWNSAGQEAKEPSKTFLRNRAEFSTVLPCFGDKD